MNFSKKGLAPVVLIGALAVVALLALFKPKILDGDSRRAADSKQASAQVETDSQKALEAEKAKGAAAAASIQSISNATADLPPSRATDFVRREVTVPLSLLPKPDFQALLEAEKRRAAVMEGRLQVAEGLYKDAAKENSALLERSVKAEGALEKAFQQRRQVDSELAEAAAACLAAEHQRNAFLLVAVVAVGLWVWGKIYGVSPATIGSIITDIRSGTDPTVAIDTHTSPLLHKYIARAAKLAK